MNTICTCEQLLLKGHDKLQTHLELHFKADLETYGLRQKRNILHHILVGNLSNIVRNSSILSHKPKYS